MAIKTIEQCEREFSDAVQEFINAAVAKGHSLETAKVMARDVVARAAQNVQGRVHMISDENQPAFKC